MNKRQYIFVVRKGWLLLVSLLFTFHFPLFTSCQAEAPVSRKYNCQLVFYYDQHPTSLLFAAARSAGAYVYVTSSGDGSSSFRHIYVTSNDGKTPREDNIISTEIEKRTACVLGASNSIGRRPRRSPLTLLLLLRWHHSPCLELKYAANDPERTLSAFCPTPWDI